MKTAAVLTLLLATATAFNQPLFATRAVGKKAPAKKAPAKKAPAKKAPIKKAAAAVATVSMNIIFWSGF